MSRRHPSAFGYFLLKLICVILGIAVGFLAGIYWLLSQVTYVPVTLDSAKQYQQDLQNGIISVAVDADHLIKPVAQKQKGIEHYLIAGIDAREVGAARTDSMMILTIDRNHRQLKLTSLMRDIEVALPGRQDAHDKLNSAYAHGGIGMLINVINESFDLDIQSFFILDFYKAVHLVDAVGGVDVTLSDAEVAATNIVMREMRKLLSISENEGTIERSGQLHLNGLQAVAWSRVREIGSDHARTGRQRELVSAWMKQFNQLSFFKKLAALQKVLPEVQTNLKPFALMHFGYKTLLTSRSIKQYKVPKDESYYHTNTDNWNILLDWERQISDLHQFMTEKID